MINAQFSSIKPSAISDDDAPPSTVRSVCESAEAESPQSSALTSVEEMGKELRARGPLAPGRAVLTLRKAARALADAQTAGIYPDTRNHVFWLGAVLFYALTGKAPLETAPGASSRGVPPRPSSLSPHKVPAAIDALVLKCLAANRTDRFGSVVELSVALDTLPIPTPVGDAPAGNEISGFFRRERLAYRRRTGRGPRGASRTMTLGKGKPSIRPAASKSGSRSAASKPVAHKIGAQAERPAVSLRAALLWLKVAACLVICLVVCSCSVTHERASNAPEMPAFVATSAAPSEMTTVLAAAQAAEATSERTVIAPVPASDNFSRSAPLALATRRGKARGWGAGNKGLDGNLPGGLSSEHCIGGRRIFADNTFVSADCEADAHLQVQRSA